MSLSVRLYALVALALAVLVGALTYSLFQSYDTLVHERRMGLAQINDNAVAILNKYHKMEQEGTLTREEAQERAKDVIGAMRYQPDGYMWINDMQPAMVMHPIKPELNGKDLSQNKDPNGKFLFVEFVNTVKAGKEGFVDYYWPKPGFEEPVEKLSHVIGFDAWGWVVGTGVYSDDLAVLFRGTAIRYGVLIGFATIGLVFFAYLVVRSVVNPINRLKGAMQDIAEEKVDVEVADTNRKDEIGGMAKTLQVLRNSVRERIELRDREVQQQASLNGERERNEINLRTASERQNHAINALGSALERLAEGDLTVQIGVIGSEYEKLRDDFNAAAASLHEVIQAIAGSSSVVNDSADSIGEATNMLARRTEQQAAALEETAGALAEITATVEISALRNGSQPVVAGSREILVSPRGQVSLAATDLFGAFFDTTYAFRFGPPAHDVSVGRLLIGEREAASVVHFPRGRTAAMHEATLAVEAGEDAAGAFVRLSTDRLAQSVSLSIPGYLPEDNWFHLAPGRPKVVRLHPFGEGPERIDGEIRQLGSSSVIHV